MSNDPINSKTDIIEALNQETIGLVQWASTLNDDDFFKSINEKWSTGGQIEHLRKSSRPIVLALKLPAFMLKIVVGSPNRPSRSFAEVKEKYLLKLELQGITTTRYYPKLDQQKSKKKVLDDYMAVTNKLTKAIAKWKDQDLDSYILPHPLLGKVTIREMLFFTIYHTEHHFASIKNLYSE